MTFIRRPRLPRDPTPRPVGHRARLVIHLGLIGFICAATVVTPLPMNAPGILLPGAPVAHAMIFLVTKTADTNDGACNVADCSLREAIVAANAAPGPDSIIVPAGTYTLTITGIGEDLAATGDLDITDELTISGAGADSTIIDGNGAIVNDRVVDIFNPASVTISGVTIRNGGSGGNGGILNRSDATFALSNSAVLNNNGVGISILNSGSGVGTVNLNATAVISNSSGGVSIFSGSASVNVNVNNSTISGNNANVGGGIYTEAGTIKLNNATITNNTATSGGGIRVTGGGTVNLKNTILAGNTASDGSSDCRGSLSSVLYSLIQTLTGACTISGANNIIGQAANVGPLQNNGGPTATHALLPSSPAINAGDPAGCTDHNNAPLPSDQRGTGRGAGGQGQGGRCDIGAFELPAVQFSSATYSVPESAGSAVITATLDAVSALTVTVAYTTSNGTALAGVDYIAVSNSLTIPPFQSSMTFTVPILSDPIFEGNETVNLGLSSPTGTQLDSPAAAVLTIVDDDLAPRIEFDSAAYSVAETGGSATITVTLSNPSAFTTTVNFATSNGTATAGSDYASRSGTLTYNPNDVTKTFTVPITDDTTFEGDETISLTLSSPTPSISATLGSRFTAVLTILDNETQPTVQFSSSTFSRPENAGPAVITVTLSHPSAFTTTVNFASGGGTATPDLDYTPVNGTLVFTPSFTLRTFTVPITDDTLYEGNETLGLSLSNPVSATLGLSTAVLTIVDNDLPAVRFSASQYSVWEAAGPAVVTVTLSNLSVFTTSVTFTTSNGTASAGSDYAPVSTVLAIPPGQLQVSTFVPITDDAAFEGNETVLLALTSPISASLGSPSTATLTILDDDDVPVQFSLASYSVGEAAGSAVITVTLAGAANVTATVVVSSTNLTALAGTDYGAINTTLTFTPGVIAQTVLVPITNDNLYEGNETFRLTLRDASGAIITGTNPVTVTIVDDDFPTVQFSSASYSVGEGGGSALITVTLSNPSLFTTTVAVSTTVGTATPISDFIPINTTLIFTPGGLLATFGVPIVDDALQELDEAVGLALGNPSGAALGSPATAVLTIVDNDLPAVRFASSTYSAGEAGGFATITVTLSNPPATTARINFATSNGTAIAGVDYLPASGTLTFTQASTTRTFTVTLLNDSNYKGNRTVLLTLSNPVSVTLGSPSQATLTILEDEAPPPVYLPLVLKHYSRFFQGPSEAEPNNTANDANGPIELNKDYSGYPNDNWDFWSFELPSAGQVTVELVLPPNYTGQDTQLQLHFPTVGSGTLVGFAAAAPYRIVHSGQAGTYFVIIYTASGFSSSTPYTLRVSRP